MSLLIVATVLHCRRWMLQVLCCLQCTRNNSSSNKPIPNFINNNHSLFRRIPITSTIRGPVQAFPWLPTTLSCPNRCSNCHKHTPLIPIFQCTMCLYAKPHHTLMPEPGIM